METRKTQWHPAFCSAVRLELRADKQTLQYTNEYNLNTKPLQIDLLVIKKPKDTVLKNEIGKIFRGHNILEYKSPDDVMNVDTYYKTLAYAYLYKAGGSHRWLTALTRSMESEEARKLVLDIRALKEKDEKEYADSVFDVTLKENRQLFETLKKEGESMCEALAELMRPELEQAVKKAKEEAEKETEKAKEETEKAKKEAEQAKAEAIKAECITERERRRADAAESEVLYLREEIRRLKENGNSRE